MSKIKVLIYPYGSDEPLVDEIENNPHHIMQILEGDFTDIPLPNNLVLLVGDDAPEHDYKYQEKFDIYGNFIIAKHNYKRFMSLSDAEIDYFKEKSELFIKGPYPSHMEPDIDTYAKHMTYKAVESDYPLMEELEELIELANEREAGEIVDAINNIADYTKIRSKFYSEKNLEKRIPEKTLEKSYQEAKDAISYINSLAEKYQKDIIYPGNLEDEFTLADHIVNTAVEHMQKSS